MKRMINSLPLSGTRSVPTGEPPSLRFGEASHGAGMGVGLSLLILTLFTPLCLGLTALGAQRLDLFHAAFVNACTGRAYQVHWQDARRYPQDFRYDFFLSPDSLVVLEIWLEGAPTISFSRTFPLDCPSRG